MTQQLNDAPTSSYSDPFYDRLEAVSRWLRQRIWLVLAGIALVVVAAIATRQALTTHPEAGSAASFLRAQEAAQALAATDRAKAVAIWQSGMADPGTTPYFKARAALELAQVHLLGAETTAARDAVAKATGFAAQAKDAELSAAVVLTRAAVEFQAGELETALAAYADAGRTAGSRQPMLQFEAALGQSRALERLNRLDDAVAVLEPLTTRNDNGAETLVAVAKARYWSLRRRIEEAKAAPAAAAPAPSATPAAN